MPKNILISNIRLLRLKKRFTQQYVSDAVGANTLSTVQSWEYGRSLPNTNHLEKLSQLFGCTIDALCRHDFNKYPIHQ